MDIIGTEEKTAAEELFDRLFAVKSKGSITAEVEIGGITLSGQVNALDRSGANRLTIGFNVAPDLSIEWRGRRQALVEEASEDFVVISDGLNLLKLTFHQG